MPIFLASLYSWSRLHVAASGAMRKAIRLSLSWNAAISSFESKLWPAGEGPAGLSLSTFGLPETWRRKTRAAAIRNQVEDLALDPRIASYLPSAYS